ncbi:MAG: hypothetical protein ABIF92_01230 [archaeon]
MSRKKEHHDIESVLEHHLSSDSDENKAEPENTKKTSRELKKEKKEQEVQNIEGLSAEEKKEFVEEKLEEIGEAIEEEVDEALEKALEDSKNDEDPVAVFVKDKETAKQIGNLRKAVANGIETTQKNVVVFYEQASNAGDRVRGFIYVLLGLSVMFTGFFAKDIDFVSFKEILVELSRSLIGRAIVFTIGFSLFAYGTRKFFQGIWTTLTRKFIPKKKEKFVQKKLV